MDKIKSNNKELIKKIANGIGEKDLISVQKIK